VGEMRLELNGVALIEDLLLNADVKRIYVYPTKEMENGSVHIMASYEQFDRIVRQLKSSMIVPFSITEFGELL
jgi:hypothetical protein